MPLSADAIRSQPRPWLGHALLLLTAAVWGFGFVAQRAGMESLGPFTYNALRFALGAAALELLRWGRGTSTAPGATRAGMRLGLLMFAGASLQQAGMVTTTAGKAGFITGLYVVLVPLLVTWQGKRQTREVWGGALLAVAGLYLLSVTRGWRVEQGDLLVLLSAWFWALHVVAVDHWAGRYDSLTLAVRQFWVVAGLSALVAAVGEAPSWHGLQAAWLPVLYGGLVSVGVGYTLQVVGQQFATAGPAAIILSLEAVFALVGGVLLLGETVTPRGLAGAALMFAGMVWAQREAENRGQESRGPGPRD